MLVLYSIFIYKNATILIVNDVREIGHYFKESQKTMNQLITIELYLESSK